YGQRVAGGPRGRGRRLRRLSGGFFGRRVDRYRLLRLRVGSRIHGRRVGRQIAHEGWVGGRGRPSRRAGRRDSSGRITFGGVARGVGGGSLGGGHPLADHSTGARFVVHAPAERIDLAAKLAQAGGDDFRQGFAPPKPVAQSADQAA